MAGVSVAISPCPPEKAVELLNGPEIRSGGLSQDPPAGPQQWVTLAEEPFVTLTGTFTIAAGGLAVIGTDTLATEELSASPPTAIVFDDGDPLLVDEITDDFNFTLTEPHVEGVTDADATADIIGAETRWEGSRTFTEIDPRELEVDRRRIYSLRGDFRVGRRTVRIPYRRGFLPGKGPPAVALLSLEMVKSVFTRKRRRSSKVSVPGAFSVSWASFADEAEAFMAKADLLRRPLTFGA